MFKNINVICTGNICRSPMGAALLREQLAGRGVTVGSAGTYAMTGHAADALAIEVMRDHGHDITAHRARQATLGLLKDCDLILALDRSHVSWITQSFPQLRGRVYKLGRWQNDADIADPYREPKAAFEEAYQRIAEGVASWVKQI